MPEPLPPDVIVAIDASNKIEAIRRLRAHTGLGLAEAKEAVEAGHLKSAPEAERASSTELPPEAVAALRRGSRIDAIRIVRTTFGIDLKDAKAIVDAAAVQHEGGGTTVREPRAPGEGPPTGTGLLRWLVVGALLGLGIWWMFFR